MGNVYSSRIGRSLVKVGSVCDNDDGREQEREGVIEGRRAEETCSAGVSA